MDFDVSAQGLLHTRDLDSFNFRESAVDETRIRQLHTGEYMSAARNIVFVGGTGQAS